MMTPLGHSSQRTTRQHSRHSTGHSTRLATRLARPLAVPRAFQPVAAFWFGLTLPMRASRLIFSKPKLIFWSLLPVGITLLLYSFVISKLQDSATSGFKHLLTNWGLNPEAWIATILLILTQIFIFLVGALTFSFVATLVACPFNDFLAESTEPYTFPPLAPPPQRSFFEKLKLLFIDLLKTTATAIAAMFTLLLSWIPIVNLVALAVTFLLISFQYLSYPQTRRGIGLFEGARFMRRHFFACLGFGATLSFLFALPLVSSFALPLAVVGGTLLFAQDSGLDSRQD